MVRYLLDTNIVSFLVRQNPPALVHRVRSMASWTLALSAISEAELRLGLAITPRDAKVIPATENFLSRVSIYPWDFTCAAHYAVSAARQRRLGKPLAVADAMIAAHALALGCVLVSNDAVFQQVEGLTLEDWTKGPQRT